MNPLQNSQLHVQTITSLSALYALKEPLRNLVDATGALVFSRPAFLFPWSRAAVANGLRPACLALWRGNELVGFAPFFDKRDPRALMGRRLSPPRYGSSPPFDILLTCDEAEGIEVLAQTVLRQDWVDQTFPLVLADSRFAGVWADWFAAKGHNVERTAGPSYLTMRWDVVPESTLEVGIGKFRREIMRLRRRVEAEAQINTYRGGRPLDPVLDDMAQVIASSWKQSGEMERRGLAALQDLARSLDAEGLLKIDFIHLQDAPIAYLFEILDPSGARHAFHNAHDGRQNYYSPGIVILDAALKSAAADGLANYDFWGNRPYFRKIANGERLNTTVSIQRSGAIPAVQRHAMRLLARKHSAKGEDSQQ